MEVEAYLLSYEARTEFLEVLIAAESVQIGEHGVTLHVTRVADLKVVRVGKHTLHLFVYFFGAIRKVYAVSERFAHLGLSVSSRESQASLLLRK